MVCTGRVLRTRWKGSWKVFPDHPDLKGVIEFKSSDLAVLELARDSKKK